MALIQIDQTPLPAGTPGSSRDTLVLGTLVVLTAPGVSGGTWAWEIIAPPGSSATLSGGNTSTASFTPDVRGTYLAYLVHDGVPSYTLDSDLNKISTQGGCGVKFRQGTRALGVGETLQFSTVNGWAEEFAPYFETFDAVEQAKGASIGTVFCADVNGDLARLAPGSVGQVLQANGAALPSWATGPVETLQAAYDAGQTIVTGVGGPVSITNPSADAANVLELATTALGTGAALSIANPGAGAAISIDNGQVLADPSATGTLPSYAFLGADNYGMYYDSSETRLVAGGQVIAQLSISQIVLSTSGVEALLLDASQDAHFSGAVYPDATDVNDLGSATLAWNTVYQNLVHLKEGTGPGFQAGWGSVWVKNDTANTLWFTDDTGAQFQIGGAGAGAGLTSLSVVNIDDPSTELNAIAGVSKGDTRLVYQTVVGTDSWTIYAWDDADSGAENVPYTIDGSSGMWSAIGGKYTASVITLRNGSSSNMSLNFAGSTSTGFYKGVGSSIMANAGGSGSARFLPNQLAATAVGSAATPSITQNNNLSTGLFFSSGSLGFTTSGVEALLLSAAQDANFAGDVTLGLTQRLVLDSDDNTYIYSPSDNEMQFYVSGTLITQLGTAGLSVTQVARASTAPASILSLTTEAHTLQTKTTVPMVDFDFSATQEWNTAGILGDARVMALYAPTYTGSAATVTILRSSTLYIDKAPVASTNVAQTDAYALFVDAGGARIDGPLHLHEEALDIQTFIDLRYIQNPTNEGVVDSIGVTFDFGSNIGYTADGGAIAVGLELLSPTFSSSTGTSSMGGTRIATLYIDDAPTLTGGLMSFSTDAYALFVDAGYSRFDGAILPSEGNETDPGIAWGASKNTGFVGSATAISQIFSGTKRQENNGSQILRDTNGGATSPGFAFLGDADTGLQRLSANTVHLIAGGVSAISGDNNTTAGETRLRVWDVDNGTLERVTVGAADSGGAGYKVLRIAN